MSPMYEADESYGDDDISYCYHAKEGGGGGVGFYCQARLLYEANR